MKTNDELTREYFSVIDRLDGDIAGRRAAQRYMASSTAKVHHRVVDCSFVPRLFDKETYLAMKNTAETSHRILCKVMQRYLDDPAYREAFDFDPRLVELILLPRDYDSLLPFARVDTFLNENDHTVKFCEFNGDGSSGLNENREITNSLLSTATYQEFASTHDVADCDLFDSWVTDFCAIYDTYAYKVESPRFAICDYLENGVVDEFHMFAKMFEERGIPCVVEDVRNLTFDGETLRDSHGNQVNAIWRRCVTNDVIEYWDQSQALIDAVRAQKVALIGSFAGHIVHDKQLFNVLYDPRTKAFLTDEENEFVAKTVPFTAFLDDEHVSLESVRATKDEWIIKPTDHYGADDVYAGSECSQEKWEELVNRFANGAAGFPFIVQTYINPFKTDTLPPDTGIEDLSDAEVNRAPKPYNNLNGLYLFNGRFQGVFSRLGPQPTISKHHEGITAATLWIDDAAKAYREDAETRHIVQPEDETTSDPSTDGC